MTLEEFDNLDIPTGLYWIIYKKGEKGELLKPSGCVKVKFKGISCLYLEHTLPSRAVMGIKNIKSIQKYSIRAIMGSTKE